MFYTYFPFTDHSNHHNKVVAHLAAYHSKVLVAYQHKEVVAYQSKVVVAVDQD